MRSAAFSAMAMTAALVFPLMMAAKRFSVRMIDAPSSQRRLRLAREIPVELGLEELGKRDGQRDFSGILVVTRLNEDNPGIGFFGQARCKHAPRRAGADNNVIKIIFHFRHSSVVMIVTFGRTRHLLRS